MSQENENRELDNDTEEIQEEVDETEEVEDETPEEVEESEDSETEIDWKARAEKAESLIQKNKKSNKKIKKETKEKVSASDDAVLSRLEIRGVMDSADQEEVLRASKVLGVSPVEALSDPFVKSLLEASKKARGQQAATVTHGNRTAASKDTDIDRAVRRYEKDGTLPESSALTSKVLDRLKAQQS